MSLTNFNNKPEELAAIDLGSNSFHMVIARIVHGALQVLGRLKKHIHLANRLDHNNLLDEEAIEDSITCLALFAQRLQGLPANNVCIVGTHVLRQAANTQEFLKRASEVIPYPINIISGKEEARLIFMGVAHTQPEKGCKLVIDIGGGSTEIVIGKDFYPILIESCQMGCISFARQFFPNGYINKKNFQEARLVAAQKLEQIAWQYRIQGWQSVLGTSGSIKAINEALIIIGKKDGLITANRLELLCNKILKYQHFSELRLLGLSEERQALFVPGLSILCGIFDALVIKQLRFSDGALREGMLYEMKGRFRHQDIRIRTAHSLAKHYNVDQEQAYRVLSTVEQLYTQWLVQNSKLAHSQLEELLKWAAILHEVGLSINYNGMHRHSAYIIQHTSLPGFNQEQQILLATLMRCQRKSIKLNELPHLILFKKKQYIPLIQILRLATLLNNQRQSTIIPNSLTLETNNFCWILRFPMGYLEQNQLIQIDINKEQLYWKQIEGQYLLIQEQI
ncbi:Exopolyphosphatase [Candidatus Profftia lariciata]|uniref:exopolyphosphatase n=1 Tax=Candidatus Profftia lariciata TaxID=1987921 RepID=UPI001D0073EE|nr:exopolyphosphatase [Candidatus Profftia lariciata]UDG81673.1 Exopolyphosphatase [Candidatus Profftia lariciata]